MLNAEMMAHFELSSEEKEFLNKKTQLMKKESQGSLNRVSDIEKANFKKNFQKSGSKIVEF